MLEFHYVRTRVTEQNRFKEMAATVEHPAHSSANKRRQSHVCFTSLSVFRVLKFSTKTHKSLLNVIHIPRRCFYTRVLLPAAAPS